MADAVRGFTLSLNILIALTQDISPNVYCNTKKLSWYDAREDCLRVNGKLVAYETGLGVNVAHLNLNNETDVWTGDYASNWQGIEKVESLCSFHFMSTFNLSSQKLYGDCSTPRNYLCLNSNYKKLDVLTGTRDSAHCIINRRTLRTYKQNIISGYYWLNGAVSVSIYAATQQTPSSKPDLCGAYKADVGKYFVDCITKRSSLCYTNHSTSSTSLDKSCFVYETVDSGKEVRAVFCDITKAYNRVWHTGPVPHKSTISQLSTKLCSTHTTQLTFRSLSTADQSTTVYTPSTLKASAASDETTQTSSTNIIASVMPQTTHTVKYNSWTSASDGGKTEKHVDKDLGVTVGLPVGLCIALICGIILVVYLLRRYKCWKSQCRKSGIKETVSMNNVSSTKQDIARFNKNNERRAANSSDQTGTNDKPTHQNENVYIAPFPEYAVVHKNNLKHMPRDQKENSPSKEKKNGSVHNSKMDGNSSYCYAEFGNKNNQLANSNGIQTSEYSFAKEKPEDMDDIGEKHGAVKEDEYDVTSGKPSYKTSDNIYNKLQKENYYSGINVGRGGDSRNQVSESVYDSANQSCPSGPTDNIYNHLSQDDTYSDVSTRNEDKIQQSKLTDQTYDKL